ncbi:hypothetical protein [Streptomyces sp. S.PNR 29]|uniref:hypothetical protein n=1 Tax=Streptomyces sp. S.PNR 29 TaxID=2973805 RepID=UPI0025B0D76F|nr:hypothetical protein [Streptomyces sp. S.PNR 29]MDN0195049.1 hypothetical protein [Streptomyces sp. S.PNR 29]
MTQSLATPAALHAGLSRARRLLRTAAVVSCVPYLALKAAWIAGSHVGIPEGSPLLEHRATTVVVNGLTVLLDSAVIVLALVLTRPRGLRMPAWLPAFPMWVATGLLAPIMAGFPLQLLGRMLGGGGSGDSPRTGDEPFLHDWVFTVVYTGFIVQGLALGALFVLYARDRWGYLWRGRVWELPVGTVGAAQRFTAVAAAVLALFPLGVHVPRAGGDVLEALFVLFLAAAVTGGCLLAFRRGRALPVAVPLALAWVGSGAVTCWGGWLSLASLGGGGDIAGRPTQLMNVAYAGQMIVGILVSTVVAYSFAERSAGAARSVRRPSA